MRRISCSETIKSLKKSSRRADSLKAIERQESLLGMVETTNKAECLSPKSAIISFQGDAIKERHVASLKPI